MDDEWEILPPDVRLEYRVDTGKKKTNCSAVTSRSKSCNVPNIVIDANYFVCPASPPKDQKVSSDYGSPVPARLGKVTAGNDSNQQDSGNLAKVPLEVTLLAPVIAPKVKDLELLPKVETDQDLVSQVSFKKMKENEFVDMKLDSPTKSYAAATRGLLRSTSSPPPASIDGGSFGSESTIDQGPMVDNLSDKVRSPRFNINENRVVEQQGVAWEEVNNAGLNFWKWSVTGVGAICSFGVVAVATVCILILGSHRNDCNQRTQKQNLRVQLYSDDKRIKHVVHHATKLNDAISVTRGVPFPRTHIAYGCYDGL